METPKVILLVEDEEDLRFLLSRRLQKQGLQTLEAGTLAEAATYLSQLRDDWHVVLDINLPDGNGLSYLEKIRSQGSNCTVTVYSAYSDRAEMALRGGANHFLVKPIDFKQLLTLIMPE